MRFIVDECCRRSLFEVLLSNGLDAVFVRDVTRGQPDEAIAARVRRDRAVLVTQDYDFGRLAVEGALSGGGLVLIDAASTPPDTQAQRLLGVIREHGEGLIGTFVVIRGAKTRVRALSSPAPPRASA